MTDTPAPLDDDLPPTDYDVAEPIDKSSVPMPRFQHGAGSTPLSDKDDPRELVPRDPPHNCPHCHRGLGGLAGRVCPECNKPFDLEAARLTGSEMTAAAAEDRHAVRIDRIKLIIGLILIAVGFGVPLKISPTGVRLWILCTFDGTILVLALLYKWFFEKAWSHMALVAGTALVLFGMLLLAAT